MSFCVPHLFFVTKRYWENSYLLGFCLGFTKISIIFNNYKKTGWYVQSATTTWHWQGSTLSRFIFWEWESLYSKLGFSLTNYWGVNACIDSNISIVTIDFLHWIVRFICCLICCFLCCFCSCFLRPLFRAHQIYGLKRVYCSKTQLLGQM